MSEEFSPVDVFLAQHVSAWLAIYRKDGKLHIGVYDAAAKDVPMYWFALSAEAEAQLKQVGETPLYVPGLTIKELASGQTPVWMQNPNFNKETK